LTQAEANREAHEGFIARLAGWFDTRLGLSYDLLRPAPQYSISPLFWLGALAVVAFVIQAVTGMLMMLYYVPEPSQAYSSTQFIFQNVSYGRFLESAHLYTAYAMIMLAFMHMMRGYFVSVHKKPREIMWLVGMLMGFVTLGLGFTGYLLPWTIVSKSATDVGAGMISALPQPVSSFVSFLIVGSGGDEAELLRFFDLHVVVLPAMLLVLLAIKMFMLETHGISEPVTGAQPLPENKRKLIPIFPDVTFYLAELAALFGAAMLLISVIFPLTLQPEYSAVAASQYVAQPDWYFLWIYQILKISLFEASGPFGLYGLPIALSVVTLVFVLLFLLPFIDRGETKRISKRPMFITFGSVFLVEIFVLTIWGYLTPGRGIPDEQAALVLGGTALAVVIISLTAFRLVFGWYEKKIEVGVVWHRPGIRSTGVWAAAALVFLLALSALALGNAIHAVISVNVGGPSAWSLGYFAVSAATLSLIVLGALHLLYRLDLGTGAIKRRVRAFELGWRD